MWHDAFLPVGLGAADTPLLGAKSKRRKSIRSPTNAKETRTSHGNLGQIANGCEQGQVQAIITKLPVLNRSWGMYAYAPLGDEAEQIQRGADLRRISAWLYREWWGQSHGTKDVLDYHTVTRLILCVDTVISGTKKAHLTGEPSTLSSVAKSIGVARQHYKRDGWGLIISQMSQMLDQVDRDALQPLGVLINNDD